MGILLPALGKARAAANRTYCMANLRQIGVAMRSYLDDNRDIFPMCCAIPWENPDANSSSYTPPITKTLGPILREPKVFICKADNIVPPFHSRVGNTSYWYSGVTATSPAPWLAGITIRQYPPVQAGAKERNISVMSDFTSIPSPHPTFGKSKSGGINYLYADWHVSNYKKQE
jgi:prepilin-type processing-associated H-X9-DG protein